MSVIKMTDLNLAGKRVLIREDLNVPVKDGKVTSDKRIRASLPSIEHAMKAGARVMLMSHLGRPTEGEYSEENSLQPVADALSAMLGKKIPLVKDYLDNAPNLNNGDVVLFENVRFNKGEKKNNEELSKKYASLCDVYVMDAFGTAHRAQASTHGVGTYAPVACAGILLAAELDALGKALANPKRPLVAIVGGSKVSTKLTVLESLSKIVDQLIVGGGIANTFIAAAGHKIGKSLCEMDLVDTAKKLMADAKARGADIPIPTDVVVGKEFSETAKATLKKVSEVADDDMIFDIGPDTAKHLADMLKKAGRWSSKYHKMFLKTSSRVPSPSESPCVRPGYTRISNRFPSSISRFTSSSNPWKWTLSSPDPCMISSRPRSPEAKLMAEPSRYPFAFSCGRPMYRSW